MLPPDDLILGVFARDLLAFLDEIVARITADPATVLPSRLVPLLIRAAAVYLPRPADPAPARPGPRRPPSA